MGMPMARIPGTVCLCFPLRGRYVDMRGNHVSEEMLKTATSHFWEHLSGLKEIDIRGQIRYASWPCPLCCRACVFPECKCIVNTGGKLTDGGVAGYCALHFLW